MTGKRNQNERKKKKRKKKKKSYSGYEIFISQRVPSALIKPQHLHMCSVCEQRGVCLGVSGEVAVGGSPLPALRGIGYAAGPAGRRAPSSPAAGVRPPRAT